MQSHVTGHFGASRDGAAAGTAKLNRVEAVSGDSRLLLTLESS